MTLSEKIFHEIQGLPHAIQREVLDFVEFLKARRLHAEHQAWSTFSLTEAMRGLENEPDLYSAEDLHEPHS
jgi:hypothetical protein